MRQPSLSLALVCAALAAAISACSDESAPATPSSAPTLRQRCESACTADGEHPCAGKTGDSAACVNACEAKLGGKPEACSVCYFSLAGQRGTQCACATAGVGEISADLACEECTYIGTRKTCSVQLINKCSANSETCEGFQDIALDSQSCAEACGLPVDTAGDRCVQACARPFDRDHPCHGAASTEVEACRASCNADIAGASEACQTCYFAKSYWLGTTCDCDDDGSDCELCNVAGGRGGNAKACSEIDYTCNETPQCRGWSGQLAACAECAAERDAGTDASADAAVTPRDAGSDADDDADASL